MTLQDTTEIVATLCGGLFAGAAVYINVAEHPARMSCGIEAAVRQWAAGYPRAARMQAPLAVVGCGAALASWLAGSGAGWLIGGVLLGLVVPFTLVVIRPTNERLQSPGLDRGSDEARRLLTRWNALHTVRSALGAAAFLTFLIAR
jgi:Domain of unknown function (DUF1772)